MNITLVQRLKILNPSLKEKTCVTYISRLTALHKKIYSEKIKDTKFLEDHENILNYIDGLDSVNTKNAYISAILIFLKGKQELYDIYKKKFEEYRKTISEKYIEQRKSLAEQDNWLSDKEVASARQKLMNKLKNKVNHLNLFIFDLYTLFPPRRSEYCNMVITKDNKFLDDRMNYCIVDDNRKFIKFIFNTFKQSHIKAVQIFSEEFMLKLPKGLEIIKVLNEWLKFNETDYFIQKITTNDTFCHKVVSVFHSATKKKTTINILRHIYITKFLSNKVYLNEKIDISKFMCHSLSTQQIYEKKEEERK